MTIVALLIGLVAGAVGIYLFALRRALAERDAPMPSGRRNCDGRGRGAGARCARGGLRSSEGRRHPRPERDQGALDREALRENAKAFTEQALGRLGVMVEPLAKSLEKVETNVNLLEQQRQRAYGEIHKELEIGRRSRTRA